ncbi:MAG: Eco57I restriction-modification methylase domain-containing protein [Myxococcota bacterium]|nr:Eco57I restriction-modification methylase domain-containing protein [Myxococcota bacterium]
MTRAPSGPARAPGVVYTPATVAGPMVQLALDPLARGRASAELLALRICDPAIGEGAFLVEVVRVLGEHLLAAWRTEGVTGSESDARCTIARTCIAGVDVDAEAVAAARVTLGAGDALRVADALELAWDTAYPAVFARGGFDAVVGNPPYIRQERLAAHKPALRSFASFDGVADLYVYFVELAHRLARRGGRYCLITPNKWLTAAYARPLRRFLAAQGSVEGLLDLARGALFADADAFPSIVWGTVGSAQVTPIRAARVPARLAVADALRDAGTPHARARWTTEPWHIDLPAERSLIDRLEQAWPPLGDVVTGRPMRGVVTGYNRAFEIDRDTRDRLLADEPAAAPLVRRLVKGRDLRRWRPADAERWILLIDRGTSLDELPRLRAHLARFRAALEPRPPGTPATVGSGRKPGAYRWFELQDPVGELAAARTPRLFYQDIMTDPVCCLDAGDLVPDTTVWTLPSADRYLLAVLNSSLYGWYARRRFPPALNGAVRPKHAYLCRLPIATPAPALRARIEQLVEERLAMAVTAIEVPALDAALDAAVMDAYELDATDRVQLASPAESS